MLIGSLLSFLLQPLDVCQNIGMASSAFVPHTNILTSVTHTKAIFFSYCQIVYHSPNHFIAMNPSKISRLYYVLLIFLFFVPTDVLVAQNKQAENAKNKAQNRAQNRVDQKVDNAIDDGLDAVENLFKFGKKKNKTEANENKSEEQEMQEAMNAFGGLLGGGGDVKVAPHYDFDADMLIEIGTTKKEGKKEEIVKANYFLSEKGGYFGYEMQPEGSSTPIKAIMDWEQSTILTFMEEQKQIMAVKLNTTQIEDAIEAELDKNDGVDGKFTKTGKTKSILGYTCHEYTFDDEETIGTMWLTQDLAFDLLKSMGNMQNIGKGKKMHALPKDVPQGTLLEGRWTEKSSGTISTWETKEVNLKKSQISTQGYKVMSVGNMFQPNDR